MYKEKRNDWNGYMTVEASMLMPILMISIVFSIYLGFYLYDVCILQQTAYTAALRGSLQKNGNREQITEYTAGQLEELLEERLLAVASLEKEVKVTLTKVTVSVTMSMEMPFSGFISQNISLWNYKAEASAKRIDPVSVIRGIRKLENL